MGAVSFSVSATTPTRGMLRRNINTVAIIWYRDLLCYVRDWMRIVLTLFQPMMYLFIFGSGLANNLNVAAASGAHTLNFRTFLFPGVLGMAILFTSILSAISIVWDRDFGFLREIQVAPVSRTSVILGKALGGSTISVLSGIVMLLLAPLIGLPLTLGLAIQLILEMSLLAFTLTALGLVIASRMQSMEGFQLLMQVFLMPMFFLSGALFPLKNLPGWLSFLTKLDPLTYGVDPLRQTVLNSLNLPAATRSSLGTGVSVLNVSLSVPAELAIVAALSLIFIVWAAILFNKQD